MHQLLGFELTRKNAIHSAPQVEGLAVSNLNCRLKGRSVV